MSGSQNIDACEGAKALAQYWPHGPTAPRLEVAAAGDVALERWSSVSDDEPLEVMLERDIHEHVVSLPLRRSSVIYNIGGHTVTNNEIYPGDPFLNGPVEHRSRKLYRGGFDVFRVLLPEALLRECMGSPDGELAHADIRLFAPHVRRDPVILSLMLAMVSATRDPLCHGTYLESLGAAFACYLVERFTPKHTGPTRTLGTPLPPWRLKRVVEYINANLLDDLCLRDLSGAAGLSRMHFAAQFRAATGVTPHTYVLQRRIDESKSLLLESEQAIRDVAKAVGFKDAAHFISVFRRVMGVTPGRWRQSFSAINTTC